MKNLLQKKESTQIQSLEKSNSLTCGLDIQQEKKTLFWGV